MNFDRTHTFSVGGQSKAELLEQLQRAGVGLNAYAEVLFADEAFTTFATRQTLTVAEITCAELGLMGGGTSAEIFAKAHALGLGLCPLELALHFRLYFLDQSEGPYLTVASQKTRDDEHPNGLYLRRLEGQLWLRGYRAAAEYVWEPDSRFAFLLNADALEPKR